MNRTSLIRRSNRGCDGILRLLAMLLLPALVITLFPLGVKAAPASYEHNPVINSVAMDDIVVDDTAVYGFRPDPKSERLGSFADMDWDDPETVEAGRQQRIAYHNQFSTMYDTWDQMEAQGKSIEEIARKVSGMRNEIRLASYVDNPEGLARVKESNLKTYGNENGPTPEYLYEKYGNWETVLKKSFSESPGMDACLGLYDDYYDHYIETGALKESGVQTFTVRENDSLSSIAEKFYGDRAKWRDIYNENGDTISDPNLIFTGQTIRITVE